MVFGSSYCAVSRLEIEDGDKCILIPLAFHLGGDFNKWDKADIGQFMWLYPFCAVEPQTVRYGGNYSQIEYFNQRYKQTSEHEMYMLIHYGFYQALQKNVLDHVTDWKLNDIQCFDTMRPVWEKAQEMKHDLHLTISHRLGQLKGYLPVSKRAAKRHKDEKEKLLLDYATGGPAPAWMVELNKLATFMGSMGIMATPNICHDQHEAGKKYNKLVRLAKRYEADMSAIQTKNLKHNTTGYWPSIEDEPLFYSDEAYHEKWLTERYGPRATYFSE